MFFSGHLMSQQFSSLCPVQVSPHLRYFSTKLDQSSLEEKDMECQSKRLLQLADDKLDYNQMANAYMQFLSQSSTPFVSLIAKDTTQ
jgi:hypothetical protein